jgi:hypothetical protein
MNKFWDNLFFGLISGGIYLFLTGLLHVALWPFLGKDEVKRYFVSALISLGLVIIPIVLSLIGILSGVWEEINSASIIALFFFSLVNVIHYLVEKKKASRL